MGTPYAEVIGDPIGHSKSPLIHKFWLRKLGLEGDYRAVRVTSDELPAYLENRRRDRDWRGCNVTIPHKLAVMPLLDEIEDYGVGAVNCIVSSNGRLIGRNTDSAGVGDAIEGAVYTGSPVCLIGAGGAARAAIAWLDILAVYQFNVIVRNAERGRRLIDDFGMEGRIFGFDQAVEALKDSAGAINATPLGMAGFSEMPPEVLHGLSGVRRRGFALDMVYGPDKTPFVAQAERAGLSTADGFVMLTAQARYAFEHFFGAEPPAGNDRELRDLLTR